MSVLDGRWSSICSSALLIEGQTLKSPFRECSQQHLGDSPPPALEFRRCREVVEGKSSSKVGSAYPPGHILQCLPPEMELRGHDACIRSGQDAIDRAKLTDFPEIRWLPAEDIVESGNQALKLAHCLAEARLLALAPSFKAGNSGRSANLNFEPSRNSSTHSIAIHRRSRLSAVSPVTFDPANGSSTTSPGTVHILTKNSGKPFGKRAG